MAREMAKLIALEGPDGVGKNTQAGHLVSALKEHGKRVVHLEFPLINLPTGRAITRMLKSGSVREYPLLFQTLHMCDKLAFQLSALPVLMRTQDYIVCDRWSASGVVYGRVAGLNPFVAELSAVPLVRPDIVIVLDGPNRRPAKTGDAYERDAEFQAKVRQEYGLWALQNHDIAVRIDADAVSSTVHFRIWNKLIDKEIV